MSAKSKQTKHYKKVWNTLKVDDTKRLSWGISGAFIVNFNTLNFYTLF